MIVRQENDEYARTNLYSLSGIGTHDLCVQPFRTYTSDCAASGTGPKMIKRGGGHRPRNRKLNIGILQRNYITEFYIG